MWSWYNLSFKISSKFGLLRTWWTGYRGTWSTPAEFLSRTHCRLGAPALQSGPSVAWSTPWFSPRFFTKPITAIRSAVYRSPKSLVSFCWSIILNLDISSGNESSGRVAGGYILPSYSIFRARNRVHFLYVCTRYPSLWDQGTTCDSLHCSCHCWQCELAIAKRLWHPHRRFNRGDCKCQLGLSWAFVALAAESVDRVGNGSKVSLFSFPVFFFFFYFFINEYCSLYSSTKYRNCTHLCENTVPNTHRVVHFLWKVPQFREDSELKKLLSIHMKNLREHFPFDHN